jgi:hypothetical protein
MEVNMEKKYLLVLSLTICLVFILSSCSLMPGYYNPIKQEEMNGDFEKAKSDTITREYKIKVTDGFSASMDFDIKEGEVNWEIIDPKGNIAFAGYVISENGRTYRQLTQPSYYYSQRFSKKEESKDEPDFYYLQFGTDSPSGIYKLNLKPKGTEGKYKVIWSDRLPKK